MISEHVLDAVSNAYGSVLDHDGWTRAADSIASSFEGRGAVVVLRESDLAFDGFSAGSAYYRDLPDGVFESYQMEHAHREAPAWNRLAGMAPGIVLHDTKLGIPVAELDAQPHYVFGHERLNIRRRFGFRISDSGAWFDAVAIAYDSARDAPPSHAEATAALLAPHLGKALGSGPIDFGMNI